MAGVLVVAAVSFAYDVNGDGREGLPEAIHSLQVTAGLIPSSSRIIYVGPVGSEVENGTALLDALNSITDASSFKPYLIKIEPGIYDLRDNALYMKSYVDIEGSGQKTTTITSAHSGSLANATSATVVGFNVSELRFLTVENRGGGSNSLAMYNSFAAPTLFKTTLKASGGTYNWGVYNANSAAPMSDVSIVVSGGNTAYGVYNISSSPPLSRVSIQATSGSLANIGIVNGSSSSPVINDVSIIASGGTTETAGIDNSTTSSPKMFNVSAIVSGSASVYGVKNYNYSSPEMLQVNVNVSGGTSYGVHNDYHCSPSIVGLSISGPVYGVYNFAASAPVIRNSAISGTAWSLNNQSGTTAKVASTMLTGGVTGSGFTCVGVYNQAFAALGTNCN